MSHNLLSVSWGTKKVGGVIQSESKGLRTTGASDVSAGVQRPKDQKL